MTKQTKAIDILMEARDCIFCVSSAASGPVPLDNTPIVTVVNIAGAKIDKAIALLSEQPAEIEEEVHT
jgi:hypothetical protein